jgi:hypothetical protein
MTQRIGTPLNITISDEQRDWLQSIALTAGVPIAVVARSVMAAGIVAWQKRDTAQLSKGGK